MPARPKPKAEDDRPKPTAGEMVISDDVEPFDDGPTIAVAPQMQTPSAVLDAYADDAQRAIADYESQLAGEMDSERVGRLHYEIGRLYQAVLGDLALASHHFDRALLASPQHMPTVRKV